jgi:hypothetical protein
MRKRLGGQLEVTDQQIHTSEVPLYQDYRDASLIRRRLPLGPATGICLEPCGGPRGGGVFFMSEVPLYQ